MEKFTTQDLIAELQEHTKPSEPRREGGVTVYEWAEAQGISDTAARKQLNKLIDNGVLNREWAYEDGVRFWVYYKVE